MAKATKKQLRERWLTPEGKKVKKQIIDHIKEDNWERFLKGFPFVNEFKNMRDLRYIKFENVDLGGANFENVDLGGAKFENVNLGEAEFDDVNLGGAEFDDVSIWRTNFENVDLGGAKFVNSILSSVTFHTCKFENTKFVSSEIDRIYWSDSNIKRSCFKDLKPLVNIDCAKDTKDYYEFRETYLLLKNQFRQNGRYGDMSWAYLKEKESLRQYYKQNITYKEKNNIYIRIKNFFKFIWEYVLFLLFGYGEKPWHILGWSFLTIIIFSFIYKITNALGSNLKDIDTIITFWRSLYFSTITFTTVGFGDFYPLRDISRTLVMTEAAIGLFFYSLFIFTFGRKTAGR